MASLLSFNNTRMRDLITCSVCLEVLKEPKVLPCLHSYCTHCLQGMCAGGRLKITCPVCKATSAVPPNGIHGLRSDFKAEQMKELLEFGKGYHVDGDPQGSDDRMQCEVCKGQRARPATLHCTQCYVFYCQKCIRKHDSNALFRGHRVSRLTSEESSKGMTSVFCQRHTGHRVKFLCTTCAPKTSLCAICVLDHDVTHDVCKLRDAAANIRKKFESDLKLIKTKIGLLLKHKEAITEMKKQQEKMLSEAKEAICLQTLLIIAQVDDRKITMLEEVQDMVASLASDVKEDELNAHISDWFRVESDIQKLVDTSNEDCLAHHDSISERIQALEVAHPAEDVTNKGVRFLPNKERLDADIIGTLGYFMKSEASCDEQERRCSIIKTERLEMVTQGLQNGRPKIIRKDVEGTQTKQQEAASSDRRGLSKCDSCEQKSTLVSFYCMKKDRLERLCRHCRALTDDKKPTE